MKPEQNTIYIILCEAWGNEYVLPAKYIHAAAIKAEEDERYTETFNGTIYMKEGWYEVNVFSSVNQLGYVDPRKVVSYKPMNEVIASGKIA